jgi:hypothetical protein
MLLSKEIIDGLLRLMGVTRDDEIGCERCLALVAEFAEREPAGRSVPAGLEAVAHHLSICEESCEEYDALLQALMAMEGCPDTSKGLSADHPRGLRLHCRCQPENAQRQDTRTRP